MYKYGERLQIFRIERGRHREEYDLSMSYKFSKYILAFSCTWISKLRGPKGFSLQPDQKADFQIRRDVSALDLREGCGQYF